MAREIIVVKFFLSKDAFRNFVLKLEYSPVFWVNIQTYHRGK